MTEYGAELFRSGMVAGSALTVAAAVVLWLGWRLFFRDVFAPRKRTVRQRTADVIRPEVWRRGGAA